MYHIKYEHSKNMEPKDEADEYWDNLDLNSLHTEEASKPLLALLERYACFRTERVGREILDELKQGQAELFVLVFKNNGHPAFMIGGDDKPMTMWYATTSVERELIGAVDHDEETTFRSYRARDIIRMMEKSYKKLPFLVLYLNGNLPTQAWVVRNKEGWSVRAAD